MAQCPHCNAELPDGEVICPNCGFEIQLVPDYETLDIGIFKRKARPSNDSVDKKTVEEAENRYYRFNQIKKILLAIVVVAVCTAAIVLLMFIIRSSSEKETVVTFDDYYSRAVIAYDSGDMRNAAGILNEALALEPDNIKALVLQAKIEYFDNGDFEAVRQLKELIDNNPTASEPYSALIDIYISEENFDAITELINNAPDSIRQEFADYLVNAPSASAASGEYDSPFDLALSAEKGNIYYTLDGTEPGSESTLYTAPFRIDKGQTTVRAVAIASNGIKSPVMDAVYSVVVSVVEAPQIYPASGSYTSNDESMISIEVPEGYICYYSFDKRPDNLDTVYIEPVQMLEGDHIFYAVFVNDKGIESAVAAATYVYTQIVATPVPVVTYNPTPTPVPTPVATPTPTPAPTETPTAEPTVTEEATDEPTATETEEPGETTEPAEPTESVEPTETEEPTATPTATATPTPTATATATPTPTPTPTATPAPTPNPEETGDGT